MEKLIIVTPSLKSGGLERVVSLLANQLCQRRVEVLLIVLSQSDIFYDLDKSITLHQLPDRIDKKSKILKILLTFNWLRQLVKSSESKSLISFGEGYNAFVMAACIGLNKRVYLSNRASPIWSLKGLRSLTNPFLYKFADGILVQTKKAIHMLQQKYKSSYFFVVPNPFDIPSEQAVSSSKREKIILNVGRLGGLKHQDYLIKYFSEIKTDCPDWKLWLVGDGPERHNLELLASNLNIKDSVKFLGNIKSINEVYLKANIFAFTSTSEGFPNALGEAMAHGLACISFDCVTGPSELIESGKNGILIKENNHTAYKNELLRLIKKSDLRIKISRNAYLTLKNNYNVDSIIDEYYNIFFKK